METSVDMSKLIDSKITSGAAEALSPLDSHPSETPQPAKPRETAASEAIAGLSLPARMEAILYLKGRPLTLRELAEIAAISREQAEMALITLMADYAHRDTALEVRQEGQRYGLQLRDGLGDLVQNLLPVDLSTAALRTLATIALKKRILQSDLVDLRGSGAYDHIKELIAQNFIERKRQSEGRSFWLTLSEKFHRTFAIKTDEIQPLRKSPAVAADPGTAVDQSQPTSDDWDRAA
jgi:segregation and condensation protein B